ncbi:hypothetical protein N0V95_007744 [Ascochyta clinopodiicola]|nr:hypothetical protein N0V95_007744 [Ascochyta clinopodiicola]
MFYQPSDAPIPTPSPDPDDLGPYPFASPAPSPPPLQLSVDGNGSPRDSARPIFESDILSAHSHARLAPQRKNNERRKLSDATRAPDPAFGYQGPPAMGKPGAGRGFQPIDNLNANAKAIVDRNNPAYGRPRHTTYVDDSSFSAEELSRGQSVEFIDNEVESLVPTRLAAAGTTERDVHHNSTGHALSQQNSERVTSQHFALNKMRINESTAQLHDHNSSNASGEPYSMKNLRDYRAAGEGEVEVRSNPIESSEDELAQPLPNQSSTPRSLNMYRPGKGGKAAVARQGTVSNSYQLDYARTYNLDSGCEQLIMEPTANPKNFRIARRNPNGDLKTLQMLNLASVNKVWSDDTHMMRLEGPLKNDDRREKMEVMFKKPLKGEDKSGTALLVCEDESTSHTHSGQSKPTKHGLVSALKERLQTDYDLARPNSKDLRKPPTTNAALARSTRSTRATAPGRDFSHEFSRIVRFSKNPGLGERWKTYLYDSLKVSKDQVYFFNTYFFEALTKNTKGRDAINYDAVKTWTKKDDIFSYDYIVVPINENWHWYLAIICNVSNIGRKLAIHDFEQDSQDLEKVACDVQTNKVKGRDNVTSVEHQGAISDTALTVRSPISKQPMDDGDINLFEEEKKLNLIDREDEGVDTQRRLSHEQEQSTLPQPQEELTIAALSSAQDEDISSKLPFHHHKQASKKKGRRKPLPPKKDPTKPVIIVLDSLSQPHSNATRALREWLQVEGLQRRGMSVEIDNKGYYAKATQVPMQSNLSDCGLYVLGYAQRFFRDPEDFKRKLLTGQMSVETDWPDMEPSKMRSDVRNLIFRLYGDQKEAHKSKKTARIKDSHPPPAKAETKTISPTKPQFWNVGADPKVIMRANTVEDQPSITSNAELDTAPAVAACSRTSIVSEALGDQIISKAALGLGNDDTSYVGLEPTTPPPTRSPAASSAQSKHTLQEQRGSPEVRVPVRSPHINPSSHTRYEYSSRRSQSVAQQPTGTTNPLQRSELHGRNIEELRVPISNKTPENSSERTTRARSGSHDDPITFDDSQDLDAVGPKVPNSPKDTSPDVMELERLQDINMMADRRSKATKYSSPAQRKPRQPALQHDDSLQEGVGYEWQEGRDVMRAKKLSIEDERRRRGRDATSRPQLLHRSMDAADELTGMHSGSSHTVQAIDVDGSDKDHEVAETPERQRSSPSVVEDEMDWQAGGSLPV